MVISNCSACAGLIKARYPLPESVLMGKVRENVEGVQGARMAYERGLKRAQIFLRDGRVAFISEKSSAVTAVVVMEV